MSYVYADLLPATKVIQPLAPLFRLLLVPVTLARRDSSYCLNLFLLVYTSSVKAGYSSKVRAFSTRYFFFSKTVFNVPNKMNHRQIRILITVHLCLTLTILCGVYGQRIVTIQLDGTQYYVSKMNPYASELNYFLAYQYCRSIGLQLVSFETKEKADSITEYLKNAGYSQFDFWTSGNHLGSNMLLWMSTGMPFNATFNFMRKQEGEDPNVPSGPMPMGRKKRGNNGVTSTGCIALKANSMDWDTEDCTKMKDFICEQTRCYFYNYGSIPVSTSQGHNKHAYRDYSTVSSTTQATQTVPQYLVRNTSPSSFILSTTVAALETTTVEQKAAETEPPNLPYNEYSENLNNNHNEEVKTAPAEEETNEIDLTHVTEPPTSEISGSGTTYRYDRTTPVPIMENENDKEINFSTSNRIRSTKILEQENNSGRNMPEMSAESFPWAWAKNILLEKPVMKKTSQN